MALAVGLVGWAAGKVLQLVDEQQKLYAQLTDAVAERAEDLQRLTRERLALKQEMGMAAERAAAGRNADRIDAFLAAREAETAMAADVDVDQADPHAD